MEIEMGNGKWGMGNGAAQLGASFVPIDVRRADVRRETAQFRRATFFVIPGSDPGSFAECVEQASCTI